MSNFEDFKRQYCTKPPTDEQIIRSQQREIEWLKARIAALESEKAALEFDSGHLRNAVRWLNALVNDHHYALTPLEAELYHKVINRPELIEALKGGGE